MAEPLYRSVAALLEPLADLVHGTVKIAPRLLWGNAASALAGSVCALARARPAHAADVVGVGNALLGTGHLRNTGHLAEAAPGQPYFTRTTCCLYYRVPGGGMCGDCVLLTPTLKGTP